MQSLKFRYLIFIVPIVGILIAIIFSFSDDYPGEQQWIRYVLNNIIVTSALWAGVTVIVSFLWKKYPWEQYPVKHLIIEITLVFIYTNAFSYGHYRLQIWIKNIDPIDNIAKELVITNLITFLITSVHEAAEFYRQWVTHFSKSAKLEKDNIEAKYEALKSQINPHFLFNSLNSLTSLIHSNEEAVDYVQNLSEFLRYILKSRDTELVLVRNEVELLEKYLNLQKSRFGQSLRININIPNKYLHYSVPPLVLQMLVENCIKHNIISKEKPLAINLSVNKQFIEIENNLQKKISNNSTGQGLKNIMERYKFFTDKEVVVTESSTKFNVKVPLLIVDL